MVAVPADTATDVQQNSRQELEHAGNLVRDALGGMEMAGVQAEEFPPHDSVAEIKLVRTDDVAFAADAEKLRFE